MEFKGHWLGWCRQSSDTQHSLSAQITEFHKFCDQHPEITKRTVIQFVGSVTDDNPMTFFDRMRNEGVTAYDEYSALIETGTVNGIWAIDKTRYGRESWITGFLIKFPINRGVLVYAEGFGLIDQPNADVMTALASIGNDVTALTWGSRALATRRKKCDMGIPPTGQVPWTHRLVLDGTTLTGVAIIPESRTALLRAAEMMLRGESYQYIYKTMYSDGFSQFYHHNEVRKIFNNPMLYGHMAWKHAYVPDGLWKLKPPPSHWVQVDSDPSTWWVPKDSYVAYDVIEPIFPPDMLQPMIDNVTARFKKNGGRGSRANTKNPFLGLMKCLHCGANMNYILIKSSIYGTAYLRCQAQCGAKMVPFRWLLDWMDARLQAGLDSGMLGLKEQTNQLELWQDKANRIQAELSKLEDQLRTAALRELDAPDARMREMYQGIIDDKRTTIHALESDLRSHQQQKPIDPQHQISAIEHFYADTLDIFWELTPGEQNGILWGLMGPARVYIARDGHDLITDIRML
jgi:DNA-directed RNA polymerase subunit RPC12/RpoP